MYWAARDISWRILTEKELPTGVVHNMRWLQPFLDMSGSNNSTPEQINRICMAMEPEILDGTKSLVEITAACDDQLGLKPGQALAVARHLIGTNKWPVDLTVQIDPRNPIKVLMIK